LTNEDQRLSESLGQPDFIKDVRIVAGQIGYNHSTISDPAANALGNLFDGQKRFVVQANGSKASCRRCSNYSKEDLGEVILKREANEDVIHSRYAFPLSAA
jgi:hypothetical protein